MKLILTLTLLAFSLTGLRAQNTTQEEYNYLNTGLKEQLTTGATLKNGYHFDYLTEHKVGAYNFTLQALVRADGSIAGTSIAAICAIGSTHYYFTMQASHGGGTSPEASLFLGQISSIDAAMSHALAVALAQRQAMLLEKMLAEHTAKPNETSVVSKQ